VASDLARELGRRVGVPVEFIKFDTAGKLGDGVKTGAWDVAFLGNEPQRATEIAFTAAYLEIPSTYLVPAGSAIRSVDEVDREGVRIAVADQSAYGLYLARTIKHAKLVMTQGLDGSFDIFVSQKLEALAGLKPRLLTDVQKLPGARVLDGQFTGVQQSPFLLLLVRRWKGVVSGMGDSYSAFSVSILGNFCNLDGLEA